MPKVNKSIQYLMHFTWQQNPCQQFLDAPIVYNKYIYSYQKVRSTGVDKSFGLRVILCYD